MTTVFVYHTWPKGPGRQSPVVAKITGKTYTECVAKARELFDANRHGWHETTDGLEVIESEIKVINA